MRGRYHWSNLSHTAKLFVIDAVAVVPFIVLLFKQSWLLFYFCLAWLVFFVFINMYKKVSLASFLRSIIVMIAGKKRPTKKNLLDILD